MAHAKVSSSLDRAQIALGETVQLSISIDQQYDANQIDTRPLNANFDVLARSSSSQVSMSNSGVSTETRVMLEIRPKQTGSLIIPSLRLGAEQTQPLTIKVLESGKAGQATSPSGQIPVLIEAEWEHTGPAYVQGQLNLLVRIYHHNNLRDAGLDEPRPADTLVKQLGNDRSGKRLKDGVEYITLERRFALFPQKSGRLVVPPIPMQLRLPDSRKQSRSNFPFGGFFNQGRLVTLRTEALHKDILPPPDQYPGQVWLPAEAVKLTREGLPDGEIKVGDAVNMQINLSAHGLTAEQLPQVSVAESGATFSLYPDQPEFESKTDGRIVVGERKQTFVLIPSEAGELVVPEIQLDWWDTKADQQRSARLAAMTLQVQAADIAVGDGLAQNTLAQQAGLKPTSGRVEGQSGLGSGDGSAGWKWAAIVAALGWLFTLGYFLFWPKAASKQAPEQSAVSESLDLGAQIKSIKKAAKTDNAADTWHHLQSFSQFRWPSDPAATPQQWGQRLQSSEAEQVLTELDNHLYGVGRRVDWRGRAIEKVVIPLLKPLLVSKTESRPGEIPALYPRAQKR